MKNIFEFLQTKHVKTAVHITTKELEDSSRENPVIIGNISIFNSATLTPNTLSSFIIFRDFLNKLLNDIDIHTNTIDSIHLVYNSISRSEKLLFYKTDKIVYKYYFRKNMFYDVDTCHYTSKYDDMVNKLSK